MKTVITLFVIVSCFTATRFHAQSFNSYFGNIHSQTSYSDGNKDSSTSGLTKPLQAYNYAKASQQIDFYGISDHNHLSAGMTSPAHFHMGVADANTANADGSFVALYGQEWGVISGGGHAIVYGYDSLIGWDSGDYDVYVAQSNYANLWGKVNAKPGAFAYLAHPQATDYSNFFTAYNVSADNAVVGMAARSGPAFSTNNTYSNPSTSNFTARYQEALSQGYHLGIGLDHDTHNSVFGRQTAGRLVVLAPGLTRFNILDGIKRMRMYSSDDWNVRVDFNISNQPMGSIYAHAGTPTINVTVNDPDIEATSSIKIYYGVPGSGILPTILNSNTGSNSMVYNHSIVNGTTYYYYAEITQVDGDVIWTSPIWYTMNNTITANAPVTSFNYAGSSFCLGQSIPLSDLSTNSPNAWQWTTIGASVNSSTLQNPSVTYTAAGIYSITLVASNGIGTGVPYTKTISVGGTAPVITVTGSSSVCAGNTITLIASGASSYTWSTGANTSSVNVNPVANTVYTVTGSNGGCGASVTKTISVSASPTVAVSGLNPICGGGSSTLTASGASTYSWNTGSSASAIIVTPTVTTSYTVTGTGANGCNTKIATTVSVGASPSVTINGQTVLCAGSSATLSANGASSYTWNTGSNASNIIVTPTTSATYTVTGANASGCKSSTTVAITVNSLPAVSITGSNTDCSGSIDNLIAGGASSYTWSTGSNNVSINVTPTLTTTYTLTGTNASGCKNMSVKTVTVFPSSSITAANGSICQGNSFTISPSGAATYTYSGGSQVVSPSSTTNYTVSGTSSQGCPANPVVVTVSVSPAIAVSILGPASLCAGNSIVLTASGAASYTWNTGAVSSTISVSPSSNATYTVSGSSGGCFNSATKTVTVFPASSISAAGGAICPGNSYTINPSGASTYTYSGGSQVVSPSSTTSYTISGTSSAGCPATPAIITITVTPTLSVSIIGANTVCSGNSVILTANGAATYTWNTGATTNTISVSPVANTTYSLHGSGGAGCSGNSVKTVTVFSSPVVTAVSSNSMLCTGQTATLTASGANTYTWSNSANGPVTVVTPSSTSSYSVTGTNSNGCFATVSITENVSNCTGIMNMFTNSLNLTLYPNPTSGDIHVSTGEEVLISIYSLTGELLFEKGIGKGDTRILLDKFPAGAYLVKVSNNTAVRTIRLIKE